MTTQREKLLVSILELQPLLLSYIMSFVNDFDVAEDIFQESLLVACQKWEEYHSGTNLKAWCFTIARYKSFEWIRSQKRHQAALQDETLQLLANERQWQNQTIQYPSREMLRQCIERLSDQAKHLLHLKYGRNLSCQAISDSLGRPIKSIYVAISRIYSQLRRCIEARYKLLDERSD